MVEPMMYFGIGFLVAALLGLIFIPLVHSRAVRLTLRRLEAATPLSMAEIQADKDQLRAEFAMSTRRLELSVEQLKARTAGQRAELGKQANTINLLKRELGEKSTTINALEAREKSLTEQFRIAEKEIGVKTGLIQDAARNLSDKETEVAKLTSALGEGAKFADGQRIEIATLRTQTQTLEDRLRDLTRDLHGAEERLARERQDAASTANELTAEHAKAETLAVSVSDLERTLIAQQTEAERLRRGAQELETRLSEQALLLTERDSLIDQSRAQHDVLRQAEADLRAALATADGRYKSENESLKADRRRAEEQLDRGREERARLHKEIAAMKHEAESAGPEERVENALLRERINDVAAEVSRLTIALEGPGSAIEAILAEQPVHALKGNGLRSESAPSQDDGGKNNLADRIRALQLRASTMTAPTQ